MGAQGNTVMGAQGKRNLWTVSLGRNKVKGEVVSGRNGTTGR